MLKLNPAAPSSIEEIQKTQDLRFYGNNFLYFIDKFYIFGIFRRCSLDLGRESWGVGEEGCREGCWGPLGERCPEQARSPAEGMGVMGFSGGKVGG